MIHLQNFPVHLSLVVHNKQFPHCTKFPDPHLVLQLIVLRVLYFVDLGLLPVLYSLILQVLILVTLETNFLKQGNHKLKELQVWGGEEAWMVLWVFSLRRLAS